MFEMSLVPSCQFYAGDYFWDEKSADMVGRGSFGRVFKGRNKITGENVAIKICDPKDERTQQTEIQLLQKLQSPYIIRFIDYKPVSSKEGCNAIVMELARSNLRDELNKAENYFGIPYDMLLRLITHLERGLSYLNDKMVAHRDLKPANILICDSMDGMLFKLCDFGGARFVYSSTQPLNTICGTPGYLNEYVAANLAYQKHVLTYTKDECDLWSVGCTIFECATGRLPFIPATGLGDTGEVHNMMARRPLNVVCGHSDGNGRFVWSDRLPKDRCSYPESLQNVLCQFLRLLFNKQPATRLNFEKFSRYCNELTSLRRIKLLLPNSLTVEEYFDTSKTTYFERSYFEDYIQRRYPNYDAICTLVLPLGKAYHNLSTLHRDIIENSSQLTVLALRKNNKNHYDLIVEPPQPATRMKPEFEDLLRFGSELRSTIANILRIERQTNGFGEFVASISTFNSEFLEALLKQLGDIIKRLDWAVKQSNSVRIQSDALCLCSNSSSERDAINNNIQQVHNELKNNSAIIRSIGKLLSDIQEEVKKLKSVKIPKHPTQKETLDSVLNNRLIASHGHTKYDNSSLDNLLRADCRLVCTAFNEVLHLYDGTVERIRALLNDHIETTLRTLFDQSRNLTRANNRLDESEQLIDIAQNTNEKRTKETNSISGNSLSIVDTHVSTALKCAKDDANQRRKSAEESLKGTMNMLQNLSTRSHQNPSTRSHPRLPSSSTSASR